MPAPRSAPRHLRTRRLPSPRPPAFPRWPPMARWQRASPRPSRRVPEAEAGRLPSCRHLAAAEAGGGGGRQGPARPPVSSGAGAGAGRERRHGQGTGRARAAPATPPGPVLGPPGPLRPPSGRCRTPRRPLPAPLASFPSFPLPSPGLLSVPWFGCFGCGGAVPGAAARCPSLGQLGARPSASSVPVACGRGGFPREVRELGQAAERLFPGAFTCTLRNPCYGRRVPRAPSGSRCDVAAAGLSDFWPQVMVFLTTPGCNDICNGIAIIAVVKNTAVGELVSTLLEFFNREMLFDTI